MTKLSIIIPSCLETVLTNVSSCPIPYQLIVARDEGLGYARHLGFQRSNGDLIVMFDDDLILDGKIWRYILRLEKGSFIMGVNYGNISTRVFAIHRCDYTRVGGFDCKLRYCFEDGDFYIRALRAGLTCKFLPSKLYAHIPHRHRTADRWLLVRLSWEYSHVLVKYKRYVFKNMFEFFLRPFDYKVFAWSFVTRVTGTLYWLLNGAG